MTDISSLNISTAAKKALIKLDSEQGNGDGKISANESSMLGEYLTGIKEESQGITKEDKNILKTLMDKLKNLASNNEISDCNIMMR